MTTMEMLLTSVSEEAGKEIIQAKDSREYREIEEAV